MGALLVVAAGSAAVANDWQVGISFIGMVLHHVEVGIISQAAIAKLPLTWLNVIATAGIICNAPAIPFRGVGSGL